MELSNTPPQAIEIEEAVLGALLMETDRYDEVSSFLKAEMFYKPSHKIIYSAICDLKKEGSPVDMLTVTHKLKAINKLEEIGGPFAVASLTSGVGSGYHIEYHSRIIQEKFIARELIAICLKASREGYITDNILELQGKILFDIENISVIQKTDFSAKCRMQKTSEYIKRVVDSDTGLGGVSSGLKTWDDFTGGLIPGDLIILGGLPGTFKTALSLQILKSVNNQGVAGLMFEQEMSEEQTGLREIAQETGIPIMDLRRGVINQSQYVSIQNAIESISNSSVFIDTTSGVNVSYIRSISRKMIKDHNIGVIIIDYLQLMNVDEGGKNGEAALNESIRQLKTTAKNLNIPIILLSGFNDAGYQNPTQCPVARYLKGSRAIDAHADIVALLWNPHKYGLEVYESHGESISTRDKIGINFIKIRQGQPGLTWTGVVASTNTFYDL